MVVNFDYHFFVLATSEEVEETASSFLVLVVTVAIARFLWAVIVLFAIPVKVLIVPVRIVVKSVVVFKSYFWWETATLFSSLSAWSFDNDKTLFI